MARWPPSEANADGERDVWLSPNVVDRLKAMRGPGESYSDVIPRLAKAGSASRARSFD